MSWERTLKLRPSKALACLALALAVSTLKAQAPVEGPFPAPNRAPRGARFAGSEACVGCHAAQASERSTPMGNALESAANCDILRQHPKLSFRSGPYSYRIVQQGDQSLYTVTDGRATFSEPILWAFGLGKAGQTYVFQHDGSYYESRVSFFNDTQSLDFTLGVPLSTPPSLDEAAGRIITPNEAQACFGCHSTGGVTDARLELEHAVPGVVCEACHGPGAGHIAAIQSGQHGGSYIFNPGKLSTWDLADFCGSCHRSWMQVEMMSLKTVVNVRFQPYRLALSKCFDNDDRRISCLACHDPHQDVNDDLTSYDAKCLACHRPSSAAAPNAPSAKETTALQRSQNRESAAPARRLEAPGRKLDAPHPSPPAVAPACKAGKSSFCATCHMPRYSLPGAHFEFTDHRIRIVHPNEPYPG